MVMPRRNASLETAVCISLLLVKITAKWSLVAMIRTAKTIPMIRDSMQVMITEYFAALGCPDPSSFETRTLKKKKEKEVKKK